MENETQNTESAGPDIALAANKPEAGWSRRKKAWAAAAAFVALTLVAYLPALRAGFTWEDDSLTSNPLMGSLRGLFQMWTHFGAIPQGHYWPMTYTSFWIEYSFWGLNPFGYHLVNILLHGLNAALLWQVLKRIGVRGAWLAGLIFALHPVHVESVAWVIERKNTLSGLFFLLAVLAWTRWEWQAKKSGYVLALAAFAAAMLSKSSTVVLPVALALIAWWKGRGPLGRKAKELAPFFVLAAALALLDVSILQRVDPTRIGLNMWDRTMMAGRSVWFYASQLVWPNNLAAVYPRWGLSHPSAVMKVAPVAVAILVAVLWAGRKRWGRGPLAAVLFFLAALAPTLGFVDFGYMAQTFVGNWFQYLASMGLIALVPGFLSQVARLTRLDRKTLFRGAAIALTVIFGMLTWRRASLYESTDKLFEDSIARYPKAAAAYRLLAAHQRDTGRNQEAAANFRKSLEIEPGLTRVYNDLGNVLLAMGKTDEAIAQYRKALEINPAILAASFNLMHAQAVAGRPAEALRVMDEALAQYPGDPTIAIQAGDILGEQNLFAAAEQAYQRALATAPKDAEAYVHLGTLYSKQGDPVRAEQALRRAIEADPRSEDAWNGLAGIFLKQKRIPEAAEVYQEALKNLPEASKIHSSLADVLMLQNRNDEALAQYQEALKLDAHSAAAQFGLANVFVRKKQIPEALEHFKAAVKLDPQNAVYHFNLAAAMDGVGRPDQALFEYAIVNRLEPRLLNDQHRARLAQAGMVK